MNFDDFLALFAGVLVLVLLVLIGWKVLKSSRKTSRKIVLCVLFLLLALPSWYLIGLTAGIGITTLVDIIPENLWDYVYRGALDGISACPFGLDHNYEISDKYPLLLSRVMRTTSLLEPDTALNTEHCGGSVYTSYDMAGFLNWAESTDLARQKRRIEGGKYIDVPNPKPLDADKLRAMALDFLSKNSSVLGNPDLTGIDIDEEDQKVIIPHQNINGIEVLDTQITIEFYNGKIYRSGGHWLDVDPNFYSELDTKTSAEATSLIDRSVIRCSNFAVPRSDIYYYRIESENVWSAELRILYHNICNPNYPASEYAGAVRLVWEITFEPTKTVTAIINYMFAPFDDTWRIYVDAITGEIVKINKFAD